ncbi:MAG TPA: sigma-70 family RNA polymerase sigma factor [Candidatus Dormibacteraeota bacterium]|nr:sigma-70 family RNA polymerase sigma factor [Candidatus Dormibacteraeota bacterium]
MGEKRDDAELAALRSGDEAAFRVLVRAHHGPMLRLAMTYVRDPGMAEEVVQEAWLTCLRSLEKFEGRSSLKTWIYGIVMNLARSRKRRESRILPFASLWRRDDSDSRRPTVEAGRFGVDGLWSSPPDSWPESKVLSGETMLRVKAAIQSLPIKQREVITLRDVAGLDADEVCGLLSISAENQRVRLHRARAAVRKMLEEYLK